MPIQVQMIAEYLERELPTTLIASTDTQKYLIDAQADRSQRQLEYFFHTTVTIEFKGAGLSAAKLYRWLNEYFDDARKRFFYLNILNERYRSRSVNSGEFVFEIPLHDEVAINYAKHTVMKITQDHIQIEFANYYSNRDRNSNLEEELGPMLYILLALPALKLSDEASMEVNFDYQTNGKLMFYNMNSILAADTYMQVFYIDKPTTVKKAFKKIGDDELIELLQEIADTFVNEPLPFQQNHPFMAFNRIGQLQTLTFIRAHIQPTLGEITE